MCASVKKRGGAKLCTVHQLNEPGKLGAKTNDSRKGRVQGVMEGGKQWMKYNVHGTTRMRRFYHRCLLSRHRGPSVYMKSQA